FAASLVVGIGGTVAVLLAMSSGADEAEPRKAIGQAADGSRGATLPLDGELAGAAEPSGTQLGRNPALTSPPQPAVAPPPQTVPASPASPASPTPKANPTTPPPQ